MSNPTYSPYSEPIIYLIQAHTDRTKPTSTQNKNQQHCMLLGHLTAPFEPFIHTRVYGIYIFVAAKIASRSIRSDLQCFFGFAIYPLIVLSFDIYINLCLSI